MNILFIEDEPNARIGLSLLLERAGYIVDSADAISDAVQKLGETRYDLVIVDIMLPKGAGGAVGVPPREAGKHFIVQLRGGLWGPIKTPPSVPVVVVTAVSDVDVLGSIHELADVILKPIAPHDAFDRIQGIIKREQGRA